MNSTVRGLREGLHFGPYYLRRLLGHGGMGVVYEAEHTCKQRTVALKVLPPVFSHDLVFCARLQRHARIVCELQEPHIVPIHDYGAIDGQQFLDMRLIEGTDLSTVLTGQEAMPAPRAVAVVLQIASALDAAHAIGLVHGDVKPENFLITKDDFAYLVDLGIADATPRKGVAGVIGSAVGTWKYTAPERFTAPVVNHKVDIYALACVLYECLTGSLPYWADSVGALISAHLSEPIPQPSHVQPTISTAFDEVSARGMAKDPLKRYCSAGELALAAYEALSAADRDLAADIVRSSQETMQPDAEFEISSASNATTTASMPTLHLLADHPYPEAGAARSPSAASSLAGSSRASGSVPWLGVDDAGGSGEFDTAPAGARPFWSTSRTQKRWLLPCAAAVFALITLGVVAVWVLRSPHPTPKVSGSNEATSTASSPAASAADAQARLFSLLPGGYPPGTCKGVTPPQDALAQVSCDKNSDPDGPLSATYVLFPDATALRSAFNRIVGSSTIIDCPGRIQSPGPWHRNATPDTPTGMLFCGTQQGNPVVGWTDGAELLTGVVGAEPPGLTVDQLYSWWMSHS